MEVARDERACWTRKAVGGPGTCPELHPLSRLPVTIRCPEARRWEIAHFTGESVLDRDAGFSGCFRVARSTSTQQSLEVKLVYLFD